MKKIITASDSDFFLQLKNTTSVKQNVVLFGSTLPATGGSGSGNSTFTWDFTQLLADTVMFPTTTGSLAVIYRTSVAGSSYVLSLTANANTTITGILAGLNALGLGVFSIVSGNIVTIATTAYIFSSISATQSYIANTAASVGFTNYSIGGTVVFDPGYTPGLIGPCTLINTAVPFWINSLPFDTVKGPFNRAGLGHDTIPVIPGLQKIGFFTNVIAPAAGVYYLGFANNSVGQVFVNNTLVMSILDFAGVNACFANVQAYTGAVNPSPGVQGTYPFWYIVPVILQAGTNIIQMVNQRNAGFEFAFGMEIYKNTKAEILASTSYADLDLIFSTITLVGTNLF